ncbi:MAG: galactokinase, partial [Thermodesulfobacteriota bacterium]|nr:galactokinase [Thermodesulfobacteriota bacterium]
FKDGWVRISSEGFPHAEQYPLKNLPFNSLFGLFFAAISYFGFHGFQVNIRSDSPVKSALGGSSTSIIALIKAFSKIAVILGGKALSRREILHLGYYLEDGVNKGNCGLQDQAAAAYGGVNLWIWRYGNRSSPFQRDSLLNIKGQKELSRHILVAYSGKSHVSSLINRSWVNDFLSGATRAGWIKANDIVRELAEAIKEMDWDGAAGLLKNEMTIRREITPDALIPITEKLVDQAESIGCGARFAGAGAGGSIWAMGKKDKIRELRKIWDRTLAPIKDARILDCSIDPSGMK